MPNLIWQQTAEITQEDFESFHNSKICALTTFPGFREETIFRFPPCCLHGTLWQHFV